MLTNDLYTVTLNLREYGFKDQIQRAAVSIMNNIAKEAEAGSDSLFVRHLNISKGSAGELKSKLYLAEDLKYIDPNKSEELRKSIDSVVGGTHK